MRTRVKSNLKEILDGRNMSIRKLTEMSNKRLKFETVRRLYNDATMQYQRDTIGTVCELLNIEISDLLSLYYEDEKEDL